VCAPLPPSTPRPREGPGMPSSGDKHFSIRNAFQGGGFQRPRITEIRGLICERRSRDGSRMWFQVLCLSVGTSQCARLCLRAHRALERAQVLSSCSAPYTLHPAPCTLNTTPYTLHPTPYTLHRTPYRNTLNPAPYTPHTTSCTLHPTPYTIRPARCTLHPAPFTLHPAPRTLHPDPFPASDRAVNRES
jgi:hypothetical protein